MCTMAQPCQDLAWTILGINVVPFSGMILPWFLISESCIDLGKVFVKILTNRDGLCFLGLF